MTTEPKSLRQRRPGDGVVPAVVAIAGVAAAASVGWAAATTPNHSSARPPAPQTPSADVVATQRQLAELQKSLSQVRRDLLRVSSVRLPRARIATSTGSASSGYVGTSVPAVSLPQAPPAPATAAAPPASHGSTGASGAPH